MKNYPFTLKLDFVLQTRRVTFLEITMPTNKSPVSNLPSHTTDIQHEYFTSSRLVCSTHFLQKETLLTNIHIQMQLCLSNPSYCSRLDSTWVEWFHLNFSFEFSNLRFQWARCISNFNLGQCTMLWNQNYLSRTVQVELFHMIHRFGRISLKYL